MMDSTIQWQGDYLAAYNVLNEGAFVPIAHTDDVEEDSPEFPVQSQDDVEQRIIIRDEIAHLSKDAQTICRLIIDTPSDVVKLITTETNKAMTEVSINRFVHEYYDWNWARIKGAINEIKGMLGGLI